MSDFSAYREKVASYGRQAAQAEKEQQYEQAYEFYTKALDIFMHMIKCKSIFLLIRSSILIIFYFPV